MRAIARYPHLRSSTISEYLLAEKGREDSMAEEPRRVAANDWGAVTFYPEWNTLELKWGATTRTMSDDGFKSTIRLLAEEGLKLRPSAMIVDSTEFFHELGEGTLEWRNEHVVPLYNKSGVEKMAFLVSADAPSTVEKGAVPAADGPATFPTGWFETREQMYAWLTS
jgi:hypothetical protein